MVAWNRVAVVLLTDYGQLAPEQRNILCLLFGSSQVRHAQEEWAKVCRVVVWASRPDVTRAGTNREAAPFTDELSSLSKEFKALWADTEVVVMSKRGEAPAPSDCGRCQPGVLDVRGGRPAGARHGGSTRPRRRTCAGFRACCPRHGAIVAARCRRTSPAPTAGDR